METRLTEQQSLVIISEMIERARNNIQKGSGTSMIFWGCTIAFIALLNLVLLFTLPNPRLSFWVWTLSALGFVVEYFRQKRIDRSAIVKTYVDRIAGSVWNAFAISTVILIVILFTLGIATRMYQFYWLFNPLILLLSGFAHFVVAKITRFKPFLFGAIGMWIGSLLCIGVLFISREAVSIQFAILAISMLLGFVVPGVLLNKRAKNDA